jgi:predicted membrane protein
VLGFIIGFSLIIFAYGCYVIITKSLAKNKKKKVKEKEDS